MDMNKAWRLVGGRRRVVAGLVSLAAVIPGSAAMADGTITGECWVPKVKGQPSNGYVALYEWNIWMCRDGTGTTGQAYRVGLPPAPTQSFYSFLAPGGTYSFYLDEPMFWGRPTVVAYVTVPSSGTSTRNVELPTDYSCAFGTNSGPWGDDPWTSWRPAWYQTFIATGTSITGLDFKLAGTHVSEMRLSIHRDNGGNITTWPQVGVTRTAYNVGTLNDNWVRLRSNDIPTTPGQRYALKLTGQNGNPNNEFAVFRRIDEGLGYGQGQAYDDGGAPQNFDLYAIVLSDNDGTVIPYCVMESDGGDLAGWAGVWSQEVKAVGSSLAGATLYFASPDWHHVGTVKVRTGGPSGTQVGPAKSAWTASMAAESAFFAASWNPGEVPLTPGQVYYLEFSSQGFNPHRFTKSINAYPYGHAWQSYTNSWPDVDLHMQVVEYAGEIVPPTIGRSPASFTHAITRGGSLNPDTFTITNTGGGMLDYGIASSATWLWANPNTGQSFGEADPISILYDVDGLAIGSYTGTLTITAAGATNTPQTVMVHLTVDPPTHAPCDFEPDGDVDQSDFGRFQACYSGAGIAQLNPACQGAKLDGDDDVDLSDFGIFQECVSGPSQPADPLCAG